MARIPFVRHRTANRIRAKYRACRHPVEKTRWHAVWLLAWADEPRTPAQVAAVVGLSDVTVRHVLHRWNAAAPTAAGTRISEHDAVHHGKEPAKIEQVAAFEVAHCKLLDHLLNKLSNAVEAGGCLLDNTQVLFLSNMGDGSAHASNNLPILLAGGGYRHPGHVAFDRQRNHPLSNLYVRVLRQMGLPCERFGSSTGVLSELG